MVFRKSRRKIELKEDVIIDNVKIDFVTKTKFLGGSHTRSASYFWITCAIHQRKDCKGHWYFVQSKKVYQKKFNENTKLCFIYPYFTYCITVWGNTFNSILELLIVLQKRAIRIVCGAQKFYPSFQLSKIRALGNLYVYPAQLFLYKYYRQSLPNIFLFSSP